MYRTRKLLITGISGFIGSCFAHLPQEHWQIIGTYQQNPVQHPNLISKRVDLSQLENLDPLLNASKPDALIHLAAASNPNFCEKNPELSERINIQTAVELAVLCDKYSIPFLFVSTDLVFAGDNPPYDEQAEPRAVNLYGRQKAIAEEKILSLNSRACIARCPVMFGLPKWGNSFMKSWMTNLKEGRPVFAFTDEFRTKVSGSDAAQGMLLLLEQQVKGIWHLGGKESISRFDFAMKMAETFGLPGALVQASKQADVKMAAARPANVSLNSEKAFQLGYQPKRISEALRSWL